MGVIGFGFDIENLFQFENLENTSHFPCCILLLANDFFLSETAKYQFCFPDRKTDISVLCIHHSSLNGLFFLSSCNEVDEPTGFSFLIFTCTIPTGSFSSDYSSCLSSESKVSRINFYGHMASWCSGFS